MAVDLSFILDKKTNGFGWDTQANLRREFSFSVSELRELVVKAKKLSPGSASKCVAIIMLFAFEKNPKKRVFYRYLAEAMEMTLHKTATAMRDASEILLTGGYFMCSDHGVGYYLGTEDQFKARKIKASSDQAPVNAAISNLEKALKKVKLNAGKFAL